jgi:ABC-2 type transport system permease protein
MRLFWELTKLSLQRQLTYRAAALAGLLTNFFFGLLRASVLIALYGTATEIADIPLDGAITYTGLVQATIAFLSLFSWYEVMNSVYSGEIASDLLKPMGFFSYWLARDLGRAIAGLLTRGLTMMAAYAIFFGITTPHSVGQWFAVAITLIFSWLVSFSWRFLVNLSAFWTPNALGVVRFGFILSWFLSGFLMPLRFYPDWFIRLAHLTPFPHTVNTVIEVYLGVVTGPELVRALGGQLVWIVALVAASQLTLRAGVRRLVILGG